MKGIIHVHSEHSLFDGKPSVKQIVERAKEMNADFVTLTDHRVLSGIEDFLEVGRDLDVKCIPGTEGEVSYVLDNGISLENCHILLLAKTAEGYQNIANAVTASNSNITNDKPTMTLDILEKNFKNKNNVVAATACLGGIINKIILVNDKLDEQIKKLQKKIAECQKPTDKEFVDAVSKLKKTEELLEALKTRKSACKKLADKKFTKIENRIARLTGEEKKKEEEKLNAEKELSEKAKSTLEHIQETIDKTTKEKSALNKYIKECQKEHSKYAEVQKQIAELEAKKLSDKEIKEMSKQMMLRFQSIFGKENFFAEVQYHGIDKEKVCMPYIADLARELNIPLLATNDAHLITNSEDEIRGRQILQSLRFNKYKEVSVGDKELYMKTEDELRNSLLEILSEDMVEEAINNIDKINTLCNVVFKKEEHYPVYQSEIAGESSNDALRRLVYEKIEWRFPNKLGWTKEYEERLEYELKVICDMGYSDYHLIVADLLEIGRKMGKLPLAKFRYLKKHIFDMSLDELLQFLNKYSTDVGLSIGPGRGSAAGSLVCYLLGITSIDPIKYNLLFERFLNIERVSMPDIDTDYHPEVRELVLEYAKKRYGRDAICCILTTQTQALKGSIRNAARIWGSQTYDDGVKFYDLGSEICKSIPNKIMSFKDKVNDNGDTCYDFLTSKYKINKDALQILKDAKIIEGSIKGFGMHAAGVIISDNDRVSDYTPLLWNDKKNQWVCQCDMVHAEEKGLLKMDFLGLKNLKIITDCIRLIKERTGVEIDAENLPFDENVFKFIFALGMTNGVFQFESNGMKDMLKQFKPTCFEDIILLVAAYRPGPMDFIPKIIDVKHGKMKPDYVIPEMADILDVTYGYPIYQEQLMEIFHRFAGFTLGESDIVRRYMSKKKVEKFLAFKPKFIDGLVSNGADKKKAEEFWDQLTNFARYAFNKSHAAAYAKVAYITAYLKHFYPHEYLTALLNSSVFEKYGMVINDCEHYGINVLNPNINVSQNEFSLVGNDIIFGLGSIKGVGDAALPIIEERTKNGPFRDYKEFLQRCYPIKKDSLENLIDAGSFDIDFTTNRKSIHEITSRLLDILKNIVENKEVIAEGEEILSLLSEGKEIEGKYKHFKSFKNIDNISKKVEKAKVVSIDIENDYKIERFLNLNEDLKEKLNREKEVLNVFLSANPLDDYEIPTNAIKIADLNVMKNANVVGIITNLRKTNRKSDGAEMAFFTLEDKSGKIDVNCFTKSYEQYHSFIEEGNVIMITGRVFEEELYNANNEDEDENDTEETMDNKILKLTVQKISSVRTIRKAIRISVENPIDRNEKIRFIYEKYLDKDGCELWFCDELTGRIQKASFLVSPELKNENLSFI